MKQIKFITNRSAFAALFFCALIAIGLSSCSREDSFVEPSDSAKGSLAFSVNTNGAMTKADEGLSSEISYLASDYLGSINNEALYLNLESSLWQENTSAATKATPITSIDELKTSGFGFVAYKQPTTTATAGQMTVYPNGTTSAFKAVYSSLEDFWAPSGDILWPNVGQYVHFFAYAPYIDDSFNSKVTFADATAPKIVDFEVNSDYASQTDLLVATNVANDAAPFVVGQGFVPHQLTFTHALAAIRFKVVRTGSPITVNKITIRNIYNKGTYNFGTSAWEGQSGSQTITIINPELEDTPRIGEDGYLYFQEKHTLLMIPAGSLPTDAEIEADITVGGANKVLKSNISSHIWSQGYYLTYTIDNIAGADVGYTYVLNATNPTLTYQGGSSDNAKVTSYKHPNGNESTKTPVEWTVEGYYNTATGAANKSFADRFRKGISATFITDLSPIHGSGSSTGETLTIKYPAAVPGAPVTERNRGAGYDQTIAATAKVGTATPYNLAGWEINSSGNFVNNNATTTVIRNTANAYIINGPGYYRFPIVMGNGIKNGTTNPTAYNQTGFVDYLGRAITSPYLNGTGNEEPTYAIVHFADWRFITANNYDGPRMSRPGWQYEDFCLTNEGNPSTQAITNGISKIGNYYWVNFHVPNARIQGVANIVVLDKLKRPMWSYLIWLTDYKLGVGDIPAQPLVDTQDETQGRLSIALMPRALGLIERSRTIYTSYPEDAPIYVRLEQNESGLSKVVTITRPAYTDKVAYTSYAPLYQWGRPHAQIGGWSYNADSNLAGQEGNWQGLVQVGSISTIPQVRIYESIQQCIRYIATPSGAWMFKDEEAATTIKHLWNAGTIAEYYLSYETGIHTDTKVVKTIYDPCPLGYTVPRKNAFSFNMIGYGELDAYGWYRDQRFEYVNVDKSEDLSQGVTFYTNWRKNPSDTPSGGRLYMARMQFREGSTSSLQNPQFMTWTAEQQHRNYARDLRADVRNNYYWGWNVFNDIVSNGYPIYPQREQ